MKALTWPEQATYRYVWDVVADARGIETWRRTVALVLRAWGASDATVELARMGLSELLANVVRHVDDPHCRLSVVPDGRRVTVRVEDRSPRLPILTEPAWDAEAGRGLWMLRTMCRDFGCTPEQAGKTVWFTLDLDATGTADDEAAA